MNDDADTPAGAPPEDAQTPDDGQTPKDAQAPAEAPSPRVRRRPAPPAVSRTRAPRKAPDVAPEPDVVAEPEVAPEPAPSATPAPVPAPRPEPAPASPPSDGRVAPAGAHRPAHRPAGPPAADVPQRAAATPPCEPAPRQQAAPAAKPAAPVVDRPARTQPMPVSSSAPMTPTSPDVGGARRFGTGVLVGVAVAGIVLGGVAGGIAGHYSGSDAGSAGTVVTGDSGVASTAPQGGSGVVSLPTGEATRAGAPAAGSVAAIAAAVVPSVVTVRVRNDSVEGTGAGVIVTSTGYILTNNHVVQPALATGGGLTVDLSASRTGLPATIVGRSPSDDLAVIKVDAGSLHAARLGRSSTLRVGDPVVAVGAPLGLSGTVTSGIVSALDRNVDVPNAANMSLAVVLGDAIQTDAAINPGNSGGALVDDAGEVVGINSAIASPAGGGSGTQEAQSGSIGVGFAIPIDYARSIADEIIRTGRATHPYLGVVPDTIDADNPIPGGPASGAYLRSVNAGSPAAAAGLQTGDVIVGLDGTPITSADDLVVAARLHAIGDSVSITYIRAGVQATVRVVLGTAPGG